MRIEKLFNKIKQLLLEKSGGFGENAENNGKTKILGGNAAF